LLSIGLKTRNFKMDDCLNTENVIFCIKNHHIWFLIFAWLFFEIYIRISNHFDKNNDK